MVLVPPSKQGFSFREVVFLKDIKGYEGLYAITEDGEVYSYRRERFLKPQKRADGYLQVALCNGTSIKQKLIHRLVAEAFLENPNGLPQINHLDEDKSNNSIANLEWCDARYNVNYGTRNERVRLSKNKPVLCLETGRIFNSGVDAKRQTGVDQSNICGCCKGRRKTAGGYHWRYCKNTDGAVFALLKKKGRFDGKTLLLAQAS